MKQFFPILIVLHASLFTFHAESQSCLPEGIRFSTQEQIDNFRSNYPGCTKIEGNVYIHGDDIKNLDSLISLTEIGGDLELGCHDGGCSGNDSLVSTLGLENVAAIGGDVILWANDLLSDFSGLKNIKSLSGNLEVHYNDALTNLSGLDGLTTVGGNVLIEGNDNTVNLTGLDNLTHIGGNLAIDYNNSLVDLSGLNRLEQIDGDLGISNNNNLQSLDGLQNLNTIGESLGIVFNDNLQNLDGLQNLSSIGESLFIVDNDILSECSIQSICNYLEAPPGEIGIYRNAAGCNNAGAIAQACGFTISCLPYGNYYFHEQEEIDYFSFNFPGCFTLNGWVIVSGNIKNLYGLSQVSTIDGDISINETDSLVDLTGLENLRKVTGDMTIGSNGWWPNSNRALETLKGLNGLDTVLGCLTIASNESLISLDDLEELRYVGGLEIGTYSDEHTFGNPQLTSLKGLENLETIDSFLAITYNQKLSDCEIESVCKYLSNPNGIVEIRNNASGCSDQQEVEAGCEDFSIPEQNDLVKVSVHPNPTAGIPHFTIRISQCQYVTIKIYDLHGREVATVVDEGMPAGEHTVSFNAESLPPGMYFCRVKITKEIEMIKMIIL